MTSSSLLRPVIDLDLRAASLIRRFLNAVSTSDFVESRRTREVTSFLVDPIRRNIDCDGIGGSSIFVRHDFQVLIMNRFMRWKTRETVRRGATKRGRGECWDFSFFSSLSSEYFSSSWEPVLVSAGTSLLARPPIEATFGGSGGSVSITSSRLPEKMVLSIAMASRSMFSSKGKKESTIESRIS